MRRALLALFLIAWPAIGMAQATTREAASDYTPRYMKREVMIRCALG